MSLPVHTLGHSLGPARPQDLQPLVGDLALRRGRVHELCGPARLMLAALVMGKTQGPVIWIRPGWLSDRLNAAGMQPMANPARLILATAPRDDALLWAMEEALRSGAAPLVVAEVLTPPGLTPIRRLHLAAEAGSQAAHRDGTIAPLGLILSPGQGGAQGVESRWHMAPTPSRSLLWSDDGAWTLTRLRARLAPPAAWTLLRSPQGGEVLEGRALEGPAV